MNKIETIDNKTRITTVISNNVIPLITRWR
jgi:hypothetical protein